MANTETSWWSKETVAVVTGGNKGIGFGIAHGLAEKGLTVVLTARDPKRGQAAVDDLKAQGLSSVFFHALDVCRPESAKKLATWLKEEFGGIDILVNNAGVSTVTFTYDIADGVIDTDYRMAEGIINTNYRGVKSVTETLLPLLRASPAGARIVTLTSRGGLYNRLKSDSLKQKFKDEENYSEEMLESLVTEYLEDVKAGRTERKGWVSSEGYPIYSESKMFVNTYSAVLAKSLSQSQPEDHQIFVTSFCPGLVRTDMYARAVEAGIVAGEGFLVKSVAEGADTGLWLALLPKEELAPKNGKLFGERSEYPFGMENLPW